MPGEFRITAALALIACAFSCVGCTHISSCNRDEDTIDVGGFVNADRTVFSSVDPSALELTDAGVLPTADDGTMASFTYFPANRSIRFHVGLVGYPTTITPYLSFAPEGNRTVAPCAGNQCLIRKRGKDEIVLRNDTCSEFWVWLTASTSGTPFHEVSDAGGDGGAPGVDPTEAAGATGAP